MSKLYAEGNVNIVFEAAKIAGTYASRGEYHDIHCVDAAIEGIQHIHTLTREHKDVPQPVGDSPESLEDCGERLLALCETPLPVGADETKLDPATLLILLQFLPSLLKLIPWFRS